MRHFIMLLAAVVLVCSQAGCGTFMNLTSRPTGGENFNGPHHCEPFAGVERSFLVGCWLFNSGAYLPVGLAVIAVDCPLSLVGDTVTLPIAYARHNGWPLATWWGEQAGDSEEEKTKTGGEGVQGRP